MTVTKLCNISSVDDFFGLFGTVFAYFSRNISPIMIFSLPLHRSLIRATQGCDSERDCKRTSMPPMNLPSLFVRRGFFIYLQTNKGMVSIKLDLWQIIALKHLVHSVCDERQEELVRTKNMRASYTKAEVSDAELDAWIACAQHRLDEAVELLKLFELAYERA